MSGSGGLLTSEKLLDGDKERGVKCVQHLENRPGRLPSLLHLCPGEAALATPTAESHLPFPRGFPFHQEKALISQAWRPGFNPWHPYKGGRRESRLSELSPDVHTRWVRELTHTPKKVAATTGLPHSALHV